METPPTIHFRFMSDDNDFGEYNEVTNRIIIYLKPHSECLENLYATLTHELLHKCITDFEDCIDMEQEHSLIRHILVLEQGLVF